MSKHDFRRKSSFRKDEELKEQAAAEPFVPPMTPEEREMRKYEARRKITRMIIMRVILAGLIVWTMIANKLPMAVVLVLAAVIVMILGTLIPVLKVLKTDLKSEDE